MLQADAYGRQKRASLELSWLVGWLVGHGHVSSVPLMSFPSAHLPVPLNTFRWNAAEAYG